MRERGPYHQMYSRFGKLTVTSPRFIRVLLTDQNADDDISGTRIHFQLQDYSFLGDEYLKDYYDATRESGSKDVVLREIPGEVIVHNLADSTTDNSLDKVILNAQEIEPYKLSPAGPGVVEPYEFYNYDLATYREPQLHLEYRRQEIYGGKDDAGSDDLIALAMTSSPSTNIYFSIRQTPSLDTMVPMPTELPVGRESIVLIAPIRTWRRASLRFITGQYTVVIRSISYILNTMMRKTWG